MDVEVKGFLLAVVMVLTWAVSCVFGQDLVKPRGKLSQAQLDRLRLNENMPQDLWGDTLASFGSDLAVAETGPEGWEYHFNVPEQPYWEDVWVCSPAVLVGISDDAVKALAKTGRICEVVGHNWRGGRPGEGETYPGSGIFSAYADHHPNTSYRTCKTCGKCESQDHSWK